MNVIGKLGKGYYPINLATPSLSGYHYAVESSTLSEKFSHFAVRKNLFYTEYKRLHSFVSLVNYTVEI